MPILAISKLTDAAGSLLLGRMPVDSSGQPFKQFEEFTFPQLLGKYLLRLGNLDLTFAAYMRFALPRSYSGSEGIVPLREQGETLRGTPRNLDTDVSCNF
jgi:hypothetical protein